MRVFSLVLVLCAISCAQDTTATIEGRVLDPSGRVITGAVVRATNTSTGYTRSQITSSSGAYHLSLPAAAYDIRVEAADFARLTQKDVQLNVSQTARIDFSLTIVRDKEVVAVTAEAPAVQTSTNEIGNVVTGRELIDLPGNVVQRLGKGVRGQVAGENDLAQNPFDLAAEHGPSLFDARHRFVFSGSYEIPAPRGLGRMARAALGGWQVNAIANFSSGTPFTVYDSANVSLEGGSPEITGFYSSRPDQIANANAGPHTADQWVARSPFQRLDPVSQAGQFGNEGRNTVRGPGIANVDLSLLKSIPLEERARLQFRAEWFNIANHADFGLPDNDLASPNFGRVLEAGPPRLVQFGLKLVF